MDLDLEPLPASVTFDFSLVYPLPFRILCLTFLTVVGFATNLHLLAALGIDTAQVLDIRLDHPPSISSNGNSNPPPLVHPTQLYAPLYKLATAGLATTAITWILYRVVTTGSAVDEALAWRWFPATVALALAAACCLPSNVACRRQRFMFLRSLRRIVSPNLFNPVPFCDVILADILTSSAKVLGDVWLAACFIYSAGAREIAKSACGRIWGVPLMVSLPYVFRFRQCLSEVVTGQTPTPRRSLLNALKYATAFPVIVLSAMQTVVGDPFDDEREFEEVGERWIGRTALFNLWILAVLINSLYSFWWDITNDWGLSLLVPAGWQARTAASSSYQLIPRQAPPSSRTTASDEPSLHTRSRSTLSPVSPLPTSLPTSQAQSSSASASLSPSSRTSRHTRAFSTAQSPNVTYPFLRPILLLPDPTIYYLAIAIDLLLRLTWSFKLSPHLHEMGDLESGVFVMELLEVVRRWGWVYLRIEWEAVRKGQGGELDSVVVATGAQSGVTWLERADGERRLRAAEEYELERKTRKTGTVALAAEEGLLLGTNANGSLGRIKNEK
ncbi:Erd1p [Sporobolomyces koalae]|uniref:Erd1p n=1 Tax=Sporobolomyces koalae TaxID=500713 RepID=UPI003176174D